MVMSCKFKRWIIGLSFIMLFFVGVVNSANAGWFYNYGLYTAFYNTYHYISNDIRSGFCSYQPTKTPKTFMKCMSYDLNRKPVDDGLILYRDVKMSVVDLNRPCVSPSSVSVIGNETACAKIVIDVDEKGNDSFSTKQRISDQYVLWLYGGLKFSVVPALNSVEYDIIKGENERVVNYTISSLKHLTMTDQECTSLKSITPQSVRSCILKAHPKVVSATRSGLMFKHNYYNSYVDFYDLKRPCKTYFSSKTISQDACAKLEINVDNDIDKKYSKVIWLLGSDGNDISFIEK